jgi:hypothetical protein
MWMTFQGNEPIRLGNFYGFKVDPLAGNMENLPEPDWLSLDGTLPVRWINIDQSAFTLFSLGWAANCLFL